MTIRYQARIAVAALWAAAMTWGCSSGSAAQGSYAVIIDPTKTTARSAPPLLGVGTHFGIGGEYGYDIAKSVTALRDLGMTTFRDDLAWNWFDEDGIGKGRMPERLGRFMALSGVRPLLILNQGHPAIDNGKPPQSPAAIGGYADFARRAQKMTRAGRPIYEVWNEWNLLEGYQKALTGGAGEAGDTRAAAHYVALARRTVDTMRREDPNSTVLVGAVGIDPDWIWTKAILAGGVLKGASGFSAHHYNHCEADVAKRTATNVIDQFNGLQPLLRKAAGRAVPVYITETGWPTPSAGGCAMAQDVSADNLTQMLFWAAATPWVEGIWLYQLKDQGHNPAEPEDNFGLYDYDYKPKAAACPVRETVSIIRSAKAWTLERPNPDVFLLTARTAKGPILVGWTTRNTIKASLDLDSRSLRYKPVCGGAGGISSRVTLGARPIVITLDDDRPIAARLVVAG